MQSTKQERPKTMKEKEKCTCEGTCKCTPSNHCGCGGHVSAVHKANASTGAAKTVKTAEAVNYLEMAQRVQADFENYKRRAENMSQVSYVNGVTTAVEKILPALDSFKHAKKGITDESVLEGIDLIYFQIIKALTALGVKKIEGGPGTAFNPHLHNAVLAEVKEKTEPGIILEEFQEGFTLGDKVIRHSTVKVSK